MFELTEDQKAIQEMIRDYAEKEIKPKADDVDKTGAFPADTIAELAEMGVMGLNIPEEYGGVGMDEICKVLAISEIARCCASTAEIVAVHLLVNDIILNNATEEQKAKNADKQTEPEENLTEESTGEEEVTTAAAQVQPMPEIDLAPERLADYDYLMNHFFILDPNTETSAQQLNAAALLGEDLTLRKEKAEPQILIYHSHSQETFADSREGKTEDTIVGVGDYLAQLLTENYGYQVMHVTEAFDLAGGELDRSKAYDYARAWLEPVLEENPSIQILIDLHRDGVPEDRHLVTEINGKPTAQIMFYNGLSHTINSGDLSYLPNPYIQDNLAFSFQLEYQAALYYPELYRGIYLAGLRYNLHLRPRALLLEAGAQTNTVQEVKNAMDPFADILNRVLQGEN